MKYNHKLLIDKMYQKSHSISKFANEITSMSKQTLCDRLKNNSDFKLSEILEIIDKLGISEDEIPEYFMQKETDKPLKKEQ